MQCMTRSVVLANLIGKVSIEKTIIKHPENLRIYLLTQYPIFILNLLNAALKRYKFQANQVKSNVDTTCNTFLY